jgi:hypothetical protein
MVYGEGAGVGNTMKVLRNRAKSFAMLGNATFAVDDLNKLVQLQHQRDFVEPEVYFLRAMGFALQHQHKLAVKDFDKGMVFRVVLPHITPTIFHMPFSFLFALLCVLFFFVSAFEVNAALKRRPWKDPEVHLPCSLVANVHLSCDWPCLCAF